MSIINFSKNFHPEFTGYIGEEGKGVFISFIIANNPGQGHFSKLLKEFKEKYEWIRVPTPSPLMERICLKKGFKKLIEYYPAPFDVNGEMLIWER